MSQNEIEAIKAQSKAIAEVMREYLALHLEPVIARIAVLEANAEVIKLVKPRVRVPIGKGSSE